MEGTNDLFPSFTFMSTGSSTVQERVYASSTPCRPLTFYENLFDDTLGFIAADK